MDILKALLEIILLTTYLLKGGIDASGGDAKVPDLNVISEEVIRENIEQCINILCDEFKYPRSNPATRHDPYSAPKRLLKHIIYDKLISKEAKDYFMFIYEILSPFKFPLTPKTHIRSILPIKPYCQNVSFSIPELEDCIKQLKKFFFDSQYPGVILKHAFKNLQIHATGKKGDFPFEYYKSMSETFGFTVRNEFVKKPEDWCEEYVRRNLDKNHSFDSAGASSSKTGTHGGSSSSAYQ